jgi:hypothetical protein
MQRNSAVFPLCVILGSVSVLGCGDDGDAAEDATDTDASDDGPTTADDGTDEATLTGSEGTDTGSEGTDTGTSELDPSVCQPEAGGFTIEIDNPYYPLVVGQLAIFEGDEDGELLHIEIEVLDETREVAGVTTRVIEERESADGAIVEISRNWFVQAADGTVCYYGEEVDIYDDAGEIVSHDGAWEAGVDGAIPGIVMPAMPAIGQSFDQELAPGIAEDHAEIVAMGHTVEVPAGTYMDTVRTEESTPLEPGHIEYKEYAAGVGLLVDGPAELISFSQP